MELGVFVLAAFLSYWSETELFLFLGCVFIMVRFLRTWYRPVLKAWPPDRGTAGRRVLACLPVIALAINLAVLFTMASYDVVGIWIVFYSVMGYAWIYGGVVLMKYLLDFSWAHDVIYLDNTAAIVPAAGGFLGLTLIYAGANIGDGPGWWVVWIAGGMGFLVWIGLGFLINLTCHVSERITVDRDVPCGIRFGLYLLASGLILGRASGGDWTSLEATLYEFATGWPVLPLAVAALLVEQYYMRRAGDGFSASPVTLAVLWGCCYLAYAVAALLLLPPLSAYPLGGLPW